MEGVMMRNGGRYAVAVRTADRRITVKTGLYNGVIRNRKIAGIPIIRGMVSFVDSLYLGMKSLMFSADLFAEESEQELEERLKDEMKKAEKNAAKLRKQGKEEEAAALLEKTGKNADEERRKLSERSRSETGKSEDSDNSLLRGLTVAF